MSISTHKLSIRILSHTPRSTHWITPDTATIHTQRIKLVTPYSEKGYLTPIGQAITYTQDKIQSYHTNHTYQTYSPTQCSAVNKYERERPVETSPFYTLPNQLHASGTFGSRGDAMGGGTRGQCLPTGTWCLSPPTNEKGTAVEKLADSGQSVSS